VQPNKRLQADAEARLVLKWKGFPGAAEAQAVMRREFRVRAIQFQRA
jgi:hypothetical protein